MICFLKGRTVASSCLAFFAAASVFAQPVLGQVDTFQDGTTSFWGGGASPINIPNGGPAGTGDNFLQITGTGFAGSGGVPATHNDLQWGGNYATPGIKVVKFNLNNFSSSPLTMRLVMFGIVGSRFTSTNGFALPANSGWRTAYYIIRDDQFTRVSGTESFSSVYNLCAKLMIRHDSADPSSGGDPVAATVGIDNVTALASIPVAPENLAVVAGTPFGGSVNSLSVSDNNYFSILNDESDPNATLTYSAQPADVPNIVWGSLRHQIELSADRSDLSIFVELKNYVTNAFEQITFATSTLTDTTLSTLITTNPNRFVGNSPTRLETRVKWIPFQDLEAADGWSERIDFARWELIP